MEIRNATVGDIDGIQRVASASWHAAHDSIAGEAAVEDFLTEYYTSGRLREHVADESRHLVVAEGEAVAGFALVTQIDDDPGTFGLGSLYVHPDRWEAGIGTRLLEGVETIASERGGSRLQLAVMAENNRAIGFYESRGLERVDEGYDERLDVARYFYAKDL